MALTQLRLLTKRLVAAALAATFWATAVTAQAADIQPVQIAFLPDVHFHDIYADFRTDGFSGLANRKSGQQAAIRTMAAQLKSTRLFNENYFAFLAALDDIAAKGVKLVVLPGDFSDDGQPVHVRGLKQVLQRYSQQYGMRFLLTLGNHDPVRPLSHAAGKADYLGVDGKPQPIYSAGAAGCPENAIALPEGRRLVCSEQVKEAGYAELMTELSAFGFYPTADDLYWETPYSDYSANGYQLATAQAQADLQQRQYQICRQGAGGAYRQAGYTECRQVVDASYLVEPVPGLWLLAIDANVYIPDEAQPTGFKGSGNAGYNAVLKYKPHVIAWAEQVARRAQQQGKTLLTFSHFPMLEFYQGQSDHIASLLGKNSAQLGRKPDDDVGHTLATAGIRLHVGGHMHLNNTNLAHYSDGSYLLNIQSPSIAAYVPAYKLLTVLPDNHVEVDTIVLNEVPRFDELFEHYRLEHQQLLQTDAQSAWNSDILQSANYREFANWHLRELTRQRFLPSEWPVELRELLLALNGEQMAVLTQLQTDMTLARLQQSPKQLEQLMQSPQWQTARQKLKQDAAKAGVALDTFAGWHGFDVALDFYRLRNAGSLALTDISAERLSQYRFLATLLASQSKQQATDRQNSGSLTAYVSKQFGLLFDMLAVFSNSVSYDHFRINLHTGELTPLPPDSADNH